MDAILQAIFEGTELFIKMKMKYDKIALTTFNNKLDIKVPFSRDTSELLSIYRAKREQGLGLFSAVNDAIYANIELFEGTVDTVPRVLVVFSDGDDNYSNKKVHDLIARAKERKIHIFPVAFGYSKDDHLKLMAENTGGKFYKAYTKEQLVAIFRDIYMSLRYFYKITYKPPKFWGYHHVFAGLNVPGREDSLIAEGNYDTSDLWKGLGSEFSRPILFEFDKSEIKKESYNIIEEIVDAMMARPQLRLEIQGHTDSRGTVQYNQDLSERRAKAVYDAIVERGIESRRLRYRGFGESQPVASNDTEEGMAKNRRTEFVVIAK
jgi:outer membrane protein OmpA-like peptidoglycan-associated protein